VNKKVKYGYDYVKFTWLRMWTVTKDVDELKAAIVYPGGPERFYTMGVRTTTSRFERYNVSDGEGRVAFGQAV